MGEERKRQRDQELVTGERAPWDWGGRVSNTSSSPPLSSSSLLLSHLCLNRPPLWSMSIPIYLYNWQEPPGSSLVPSISSPPTPPEGAAVVRVGRGACFVPFAEALELSLAHFCSSHVRYSQQRVSASSSTLDCIV